MGTRAKISDRDARANEFDAIERASWMLPADSEWTAEDLWALDAEREARAILAETEPEIPGRNACHPDYATGTGYTLWAAYEAALAESLAAFVQS